MNSKLERIKDNYGRPVLGLRISVTSNCNLNCFYCHKEGCVDGERSFSPEEIEDLVEVGADLGIKSVKLTGGEPLVREDIEDVVKAVSKPRIKDVSITTNGTALPEKAADLSEAGLDRANVSLDTLDEDTYERITGSPSLDRVLEGIDSALESGLDPVKLNTLVMKGINDDEIDWLIQYSSKKGTILQLIELEEVLPENKDIYEKYHMSLDSIEKKIKERSTDVRTRWLMQMRRKYILNDGSEVEIINPMHNSEFCAHCTRLRVTSDGYLKPCLMRNDNLVDVLTPLRSDDTKDVRAAYMKAIERREPYY